MYCRWCKRSLRNLTAYECTSKGERDSTGIVRYKYEDARLVKDGEHVVKNPMGSGQDFVDKAKWPCEPEPTLLAKLFRIK